MKLLFVHHVFTNVSHIQNWFSDVAQLQNVTIEERVTVLEAEMTGVLSEIVELNFDVDFLFTEQALQDQQIFSLYQETGELEDKADYLEDRADSENELSTLVFDSLFT